MPSLPLCSAVPDERLRLIAESYEQLTAKRLLAESTAGLRSALWNAPFAVVAHGIEADPVFFYGNRYALQCFEMDFEEFTRLPSRLSAEPLERQVRERLLQRVARQGYIDDYCGVRIGKNGRRFTIANATVWNLLDEAGVRHGQAARFAVQP